MKRWLSPVVAATAIVAVGLPAPDAGAAVTGTIVLASGTSHSPNPVHVLGASSTTVLYSEGDFSNQSVITVPAGGGARVAMDPAFSFGSTLVGNLVTTVNFNNNPLSIDFENADGSGGLQSFALSGSDNPLTGSADGEWITTNHGDGTVDVIDRQTSGSSTAAINLATSSVDDFMGNSNLQPLAAADTSGVAIAYPDENATPSCPTDSSGNPESAWKVVFVDTSVHALQTIGCTPSHLVSLIFANGVVLWQTFDANFSNPTLNWVSVSDVSHTLHTQAVNNGFLSGFTAAGGSIGWLPGGPQVTLSTEPVAGGTVATSSFTADGNGNNGLASTGSAFAFSQDDSLADAGVYTVSDASGAPAKIASAGPAPLKATDIAVAPGRVAYGTNDTSSAPIWAQTLSNSGSTVSASSPPSVLATHATGLSLSLSGNRTQFTDETGALGSKVQSVNLQTGSGTPSVIASSSDTEPYNPFGPTSTVLSGQRVLYPASTAKTNGQRESRLYDIVTGTTSSVLDQHEIAATLWGNYLVWATDTGAVNRKDLVTGVTQLIHQVSVPAGNTDVFGDVAAYGNTVVWDIVSCGPSTCAPNDSAFVAVAPGATPGTPTTINSDGSSLVASAGYVGFSDKTTNQFTVVPTAGGTPISVSSGPAGFGQQFELDGNTAAWIESVNGVPTPEAAPLPAKGNQPWFLGNPTAPSSYTVGSGTWNGELVTSAAMTSCSVAISRAGALVRSLPCDAADVAVGDATVSWDGRDAGGSQVPSGTYAWTLTAANASGPLLNYDGSSTAVTGSITVTNPDVTAPVPTLRSAGKATQLSRSFSVAWSATDAGSGVASYDVRYTRAAWNGKFGAPVTWKSATTATSATFTGLLGSEYCFSVRARDHAGNVSGFTATKCAAIPLDDRSLAASTGWKNLKGKAFFNGTARSTLKKGATLTRKGAIKGRAALVVDKGRGFGTIAVLYNGKVVKTFSLAATRTKTKVVLALPRITKGTVVVIKATSAKLVEIDGLLLARL